MTLRDLLGQTVVVIGGSAGIGLETARRARAEGAEVILTGRNRDRLADAASEVGAQGVSAFDAHDLTALEEFFAGLESPVDHVMVTAGRPYYSPLVEMDFGEARRGLSEHLMMMLAVARYAGGKVRPGGTLVFMGGTGGRRPGLGLGVIGAATAALPALTANLAIEIAPVRVNLIAAGFVDTVIVGDASSDDERRFIDALRSCGSGSTEIYVLPRLAEFSTRCDDEVWGVPLLKLRQRRARVRMGVKRAGDVALASAAVLVLSPLLAIAALAVRLEMGPGVIYRQERVGLNGRRFQLLKLRSMRPLPPGSSTEWAPNADRTGRVGAFIRRYSIDELPQLVNVIRGDMSLVGPRPERPEFVDQFGTEFPSYSYRHRAMVGLTGLAAVEGLRGDTSIADRAYFDNWYIEHWSLWLDVKIMVRTASALLKGTGG